MSIWVKCLMTALLSAVPAWSGAAILEVGPDKSFARIEEANAKAQPGDVILVFSRSDGEPYEGTAVQVRQKNLTIRAVPANGARWVGVSGKGGDYSGKRDKPRAIFQINRGADGCVLEGFELSGAHNGSHNGAGVRINQANHVAIRNCVIHHNDMGIMSNGDGSPATAVDQRIEHCEIHHNGDYSQPGYNHNLYLGGTSVALRFCEIHSSLTGHNVKSRAHHTRIESCYVYHSANREFDLVDGADTLRPESHAVLVGNLIVKDPKCPGNRTVIHFGQDGGKEHDGLLHLVLNTIVTPFIAPVVDLSAPRARAFLVGNLVSDGGVSQNGQKILEVHGGAKAAGAAGRYNWFCGGFAVPDGTNLDLRTNLVRRLGTPLFVDPDQHNYRLTEAALGLAVGPPSATMLSLPPVPGGAEATDEPVPGWQYLHPAGKEQRPTKDRLTLGAFGAD